MLETLAYRNVVEKKYGSNPIIISLEDSATKKKLVFDFSQDRWPLDVKSCGSASIVSSSLKIPASSYIVLTVDPKYEKVLFPLSQGELSNEKNVESEKGKELAQVKFKFRTDEEVDLALKNEIESSLRRRRAEEWTIFVTLRSHNSIFTQEINTPLISFNAFNQETPILTSLGFLDHKFASFQEKVKSEMSEIDKKDQIAAEYDVVLRKKEQIKPVGYPGKSL